MRQEKLAFRACAFGLFYLMLNGRAWAADGMPVSEDINLSGFATLGLAKSTSTEGDFVRDLSQPDGSRNSWTHSVDSMFGIQANFRLTDALQGAGQIVWRYRYDGSWRPVVNSAFLNYEWSSEVSARVGRFGTEFYMLADSRMIGFASIPVRPATDYFAPLPIYYIDGADISWTIPVNDNLLKLKAFYGANDETIPVGKQVWKTDGSRMLGIYAEYQHGPWQARATYAQMRFGNEFPVQELTGPLRMIGTPSAIAVADALSIAGRRVHYYSAGIVYDSGPLQSQLMVGRAVREGKLFESANAGYGLLAYRLEHATPFVGYSRAFSAHKALALDVTSAVGPSMSAALGGAVVELMHATHVDQRSLFVGARFNLRPTVAFKAQWDHMVGAPNSVAFVQNETKHWRGRTNVMSVTLDITF